MADENKTLLIALGVAFAIFLFAGLIWGVIIALLVGAWWLSRRNLWAGIAAALAVVALSFVPGIFDQRAFDRQLAEIRDQEVTGPPLDLSGANVLFMGMSGRYHPVECDDLCRNIAAFGEAENVYFGFNRSLDLRAQDTSLNLIDREIRQFAGPLTEWPEEGTPIVAVTPERIDYVVFEGTFMNAQLREGFLPQVPSIAGLYPFDTLYMEYAIFAVDVPRAFDVTTAEPLFTRFEVTRHRQTVPGVPFLPLGDRTFDHRYLEGFSQWTTLNTRAAATFLCGEPPRDGLGACLYFP